MQIKSDADMRMETARIDADAKVRVAEIQNDNNTAIQGLETTWRTWAASWKKRWRPLRNQRCRNPRRRKKRARACPAHEPDHRGQRGCQEG